MNIVFLSFVASKAGIPGSIQFTACAPFPRQGSTPSEAPATILRVNRSRRCPQRMKASGIENSQLERPAVAGMGGNGEALRIACSAAWSTEATPELRVTRAERTPPFELTANA